MACNIHSHKTIWRRYLAVAATWTTIITLLCSCGKKVPTDAERQVTRVEITPNSDGAVVPPNIAPLNFRIMEDGDDYVTRLYNDNGDEIVAGGKDVDIDVDEWHALLKSTAGKTLHTDVYVKRNGKWLLFPTLNNNVAKEDIDPFITYRLIEPGYVSYNTIEIMQRDITCFDESVVYANKGQSEGNKGQCVNCHTPRQYNKDGYSMFHVRQNLGGTVIVKNGKPVKVTLKTDSAISAGVYPAWHPTERLIAYSVNKTGQLFHTRNSQKIEVFDAGSDLILYDFDKNEMYTVSDSKFDMETFPTWSPDGRTLYYANAHLPISSDSLFKSVVNVNFERIKYDLVCRSFDPKTRQFGPQQMVYECSKMGKSANMPRVSPDGRYLLFGMADFGNFHIWHHSADLYMMDLSTKQVSPLKEMNSPAVEAYHTWSSNGRWIVFSTRRDDGNYTRLYFAYFDKNGKAHKPFCLPQRSPDTYTRLYKSFNIPEFMVKPVTVSVDEFRKAIRKDGAPTTYGGRLNNDDSHNSSANVDGVTSASQQKK